MTETDKPAETLVSTITPSVLPLELGDLVARAEDHAEVIDPKDAFGENERTPAVVVLRDGPNKMRVEDLLPLAKARADWHESRSAHPLFIKGTAVLAALASFVAWVLRFKRPETVIFATPEKLTAVIDYHSGEGTGVAGHMRHRGVYAFPFSREWRFWSTVGAKARSQAELAELIEDHIAELAKPDGSEPEAALLGVDIAGPSTMLTLARGIEVRAKMTVKDAVTLSTGEARVSFDEEHAAHGKDGSAITVPGAFMVSIPIYDGGPRWRLVVRLRYRLVEGRVVWMLQLAGADAALQMSFEETLERVAKDTGVPVLRGAPESGA